MENELTLKAATLARFAPQQWAEFTAALRHYADEQMRLCVTAPDESLRRMQGEARQCLKLSTLFQDAVKTADRVATRQAANSTAVKRS